MWSRERLSSCVNWLRSKSQLLWTRVSDHTPRPPGVRASDWSARARARLSLADTRPDTRHHPVSFWRWCQDSRKYKFFPTQIILWSWQTNIVNKLPCLQTESWILNPDQWWLGQWWFIDFYKQLTFRWGSISSEGDDMNLLWIYNWNTDIGFKLFGLEVNKKAKFSSNLKKTIDIATQFWNQGSS